MSSLTSVERMVLESLGGSPKDLRGLMTDTRLELRFVINVLHALCLKGYVVQTAGGYGPNPNLPSHELSQLNGEVAIRQEVTELVEGLCLAPGKKFALKKAWINEKDRAILGALFKNIEEFVQTLPCPPKNVPLHDYTLIMWGEDLYGDVLQRVIGGHA